MSYFHPKNWVVIYKHANVLKGVLKDIQPSIIVSCSYTPDQFFLPFIRPNGSKLVKEIHASGFQIHSGVRRYLHQLFKAYDSLVVLNTFEQVYFKSYKTKVIPNCLPPYDAPQSLKTNKVVFVGRLALVKQLEQLIDIWSAIESKCPDWVFELYGNGAEVYEAQLKALVKEMQLKNFHFMGAHQQLNEVYKQASILVLSSATECFPMVILEAMQHGVVVISYDSPNGPKAMIQNGVDGLLVPLNNLQAFKEALLNAIYNPEQRMAISETAKATVKQYETDIVMPIWRNLFNSLVHD
jgi:glycosyltransferase involved in cell wall biosynthesis